MALLTRLLFSLRPQGVLGEARRALGFGWNGAEWGDGNIAVEVG